MLARMTTLEDAPRRQKLAALCRVIDAAVAICELPALYDDRHGQAYDVGVNACWGCAVALDLGLPAVAKPLDAVVDGWFTAGKDPTLTPEQVLDLLSDAQHEARRAAERALDAEIYGEDDAETIRADWQRDRDRDREARQP